MSSSLPAPPSPNATEQGNAALPAGPRPDPPRWLMAGFYRTTAGMTWLVFRLFARWRVRGREHVPAHGPLLIISNHLSNADPPLIAASLTRRIRFMAKAELFEKGLLSQPIRLFGGFPVRRFEADLGALRRAQELLRAGEAIAVLPEGTRNKTGTGLQRVYPGPALIALRTGATILPVAITGTERIKHASILLKQPRITVTIGESFQLNHAGRLNRAAIEAASSEMMRRIAALLPREYRGVWGQSEPPDHGGLRHARSEETRSRS